MQRIPTSRSPRRALLVVCLAAHGCYAGLGEDDGPALEIIPLDAPLDATCTVQITNGPEIDMETDYLPHVIHCENGGADLEALKAQAIAARSVAYWTLGAYGQICDGQSCQVYSCGSEPSAIHYQAAAETAGQYLSYNGVVTYGFFVAGGSAAGPSCIGGNAPTEHLVTYNDGRVGTDVEQTTLGLVIDPSNPSYGQNRGCMSQLGARCLEAQGRDAADILRFYYGADIEIRQATGSCAAPVDPPPPPPPDPIPPPPPEPVPPPPTPPAGSCGVLLPGEVLAPEQGLGSCDGRFTLVPQGDGNLVLYENGIGPLWNSQTAGSSISGLVMQEDGNLVLYDANAAATWNSGTWGSPGAWLFVQDDGNVVVYLDDVPLWNTQTCCR